MYCCVSRVWISLFVVAATRADDIVWGNNADDNIVWGNSAVEQVVFGDETNPRCRGTGEQPAVEPVRLHVPVRRDDSRLHAACRRLQ